ncbi:MAG: quinol:cytochrome C oxidoreductase [Brumimicrobium sp.]|nr:quinol:cytochrome C oxidoreductase [Brumimicrobium sp.]
MTTALIAGGLVLMIVGIIMTSGESLFMTRLMGNLLANSFFFMAISLGALFFLALQYAAEVGWFAYIKRPIEAVTGYLPVGIVIMLATLITLSFMKGGGIYLWMDPAYTTEGSHHYDEVIAHKSQYMNPLYFWIRTALYMVVYYIMWRGFMKRSELQDNNPANALDLHYKNYYRGALFLGVYAFFSSTSAWDWVMSIDIHWHSTIFGWYTFSGAWLTGMVVLILVLTHLKSQGYMPKLNDSHIHDVGKWIFSLSFLWSYLWFAQFMLIWYSDMPEEVTYYLTRINEFKVMFFGMFIINFIFPMLLLMSRDAKRSTGILTFIGVLIIIGHWFDVWLMIFGGSMGPAANFGVLEIGMGVLFLGLFTRVILMRLAKAPLVSKNEPFMEESLHHEI